MDLTTISAVVTVVATIAGGIFGVYKLISEREEKKRQIKVRLSLGVIDENHHLSLIPVLFLEAINPGNRTVTLNIAGCILPKRKNKDKENLKIYFPRSPGEIEFPYELHEGKNCVVWRELQDFAQGLMKQGYSGKIKIIGFYKDALDAVYKSKPIKFDVTGYSKIRDKLASKAH